MLGIRTTPIPNRFEKRPSFATSTSKETSPVPARLNWKQGPSGPLGALLVPNSATDEESSVSGSDDVP